MVIASRAGQEKIRDANNRKILHLLMKERELSKQEMAKLAGLSVPTVTSIVTHLIKEGIVEEAGVAESTGGRKPMITRFLPESRYAFGVDFSSNHLTSSNKIRVILINFDAVIKAIENEIMKINGENIIVRGENGSIFDMKEKEAEIKKAFYVECYCYDCLSAYFIRVWHEKALFMEKEWISVDIDEIKQSLWFSDD